MACGSYSFTRVLVRDALRTFVMSAASTAGMITGVILVAPSVEELRRKRELILKQRESGKTEQETGPKE